MRKKYLFVLFVLLLFLLGCANDNEPQKSDEQLKTDDTDQRNTISKDKDTSENATNTGTETSIFDSIPEVPTDTQGLIQQTGGSYSGNDVRDESTINQATEDVLKLDPLPEDPTDEQLDNYYKYFYSLVAENFPDPQDVIKKWEFGSFGDPNLPDSRYHFKENYNIEVLLDASGSMGAYIGDKTMMQIAKESINDFMKQVPEDANVSFRVYGHKGTGDDSDKEMSCAAIEQVYGYASYDEANFQKELDKIEPAGWTPLADALKQAENALKEYDTKQNTNLIYVVSDGVETCDGDPVKVAQSLSESNAKPVINIIGFNVDSDAQKQLKEMAEVSDGVFATANNQDELNEEFNRAEEVLEAWEEWKEDAMKDAEHSRVTNSFDITAFTNEWGQKQQLQSNNVFRILRLAKNEEVITFDQYETLRDKHNKIDEVINESKHSIEKDLEDISTETVEEMKKSIKKKYDEQTD